ncbi:uncharacterized protein LOC117178574 [Belonocnema kinseyi]|uniref:uncharacterized protein LOC117178574 n=1 Tax=Belonocnema kinseyi TaxID=2817044 RepID=UPI00143CE676|nr:uncharacterized protein LOC117178574 [Belonocnema kinseyi]
MHPMMGNLPSARVSPSPPFYNTGVDYAGPFSIKGRKGQGCKITKAYVSLFVCFTTKALHLELVSDATAEAFIAALWRFASRRRKPESIYSDNRTNFVGGNNELERLRNFLIKESDALGESILNIGIQWHFIPAYAPYFGEATLNSRPLTPLSTDPNDLSPLTPAHFLIGRTFTSVADPDLMHLKEGRLSNWQRIQQIQQHLWSRWNKEYISELQSRTKWKEPYPMIKKDTLVLLKEDRTPPSTWNLGRIVDFHPEKDDISRIASVKTTKGIVRRAFTKLCPLPNCD